MPTSLVLAELPSSGAERYRLVIAETIDAAREQLRQAYGLFRLLGAATLASKAEAHRLASLIRSHALSTSATGVMALTERSLATVLSTLRPIAQGDEGEEAEELSPKAIGDELAAIHADAPLLWAKAYLAACDYVIDAQGFNREARIGVGAKLLNRLREDLLDGDDDALRPARIAHVQWVKPEALSDELRSKTTTALQREPFQPAPEPVAEPVNAAAPPSAPAPAPPAGTKPAAPAPKAKKKGDSAARNYLVALGAATFIGAFSTIPGVLVGTVAGFVAKPLVCSSVPNDQVRCKKDVEDWWLSTGLLTAAFVGFTGTLYLFGLTAGTEGGKA